MSIFGSALGFIDSSVVNIALPIIQQELQAPLAVIQWITNGYLLTLASLVLIGGAAGDRWGTLRTFIVGLSVFTIASAICGVAPSASILIGARILQGAGAAFLIPTSLALISKNYRGEERAKAIGTWAASGGILMALGPPIGGWLVSTIGWRAVFFINIPVAAVALSLSTLIVLRAGDTHGRRLDVLGAALATATLAILTYGLVEVGKSNSVVGLTAVSLALPLAVAFIILERGSSAPMIPMQLFANRTFAGVNTLTVILYGGLGAAVFLLPYSMIRLHFYTPAQAGFAFMPLSLTFGIGSRVFSPFIEKLGTRFLLSAGAIVIATGFATFSVFAENGSYSTTFLPGLILIGLGLTFAV
ncbi:MAG: MFS transporter, partial [Rhizobiaceae bacterium]|nr:MFS transporter [Rhizobiaceae bacterium]